MTSRSSKSSRGSRPRGGAEEVTATEGPRGRRKGPHFVPVEDVPGPGLSPRMRELVALLVVGGCLFVLLSLATFEAVTFEDGPIPRGNGRNLGGLVGYLIADAVVFLLGLAGWIPFAAGVVWGVSLFLGRAIEGATLKVLGVVVFSAMLALMLAGPHADAEILRLAPHGPGGKFGANLSPKLYRAFGGSGRILLLTFGALCALLLATRWLVSELLLKLVHAGEQLFRGVRGPVAALAGAGGRGGATGDEEGAPVTGRQRAGRRRKGSRGGAAATEVEEVEAGEPEDGADDSVGGRVKRSLRGLVVRVLPKRGESAVAEPDGAELEADAEVEPATAEAEEMEESEVESAAEPEDLDDDPVIGLEAEADAESGTDDEAEGPDEAEEPDHSESASVDASVDEEPEPVPAPPPKRSVRLKRNRPRKAKKKRPGHSGQSELPFDVAYPFPPIELFREPEHGDAGTTQKVLDSNKEAIEQRLASFKVESEVVAASVGPAVTQYEIRLGHGIKLSKITAYEADLAAALKAVSVRVVAPIPGKDTVGIEVPNAERQMVSFRELLENHGEADDYAIPLYLGKDVAGDPIVEDLAKMPHLLIAGTTGSGKSVCINTILMSILMTRTPQQVRLLLVDPKMVELQVYKKLPHLACDVVTNMKRAPQVLEWTVEEMERRYALLSAAGTNHIRSFNRLGHEEIERRMQRPITPDEARLPYMVIVIDELADLMNVAQKDVEESIQRLAQKSRAVGLHVILATQRPSTDVITGVIKANLPCSIAFKVNRKIDSRVILDANGAEKLLGHGDMLYVSPTKHRMIRAQGAFVSEDEAGAVCQHIEEHGPKPDYIPDLVQSESAKGKRPGDKDDLYDQAVEVVLGQQRGSATLIQRALAVGYNRATRLLEMMEEDGLVGPFVGSKSREVMMTVEEWKIREAEIAAELENAEADEDYDDYEDVDYEDTEDGPDESDADDDGSEPDGEDDVEEREA